MIFTLPCFAMNQGEIIDKQAIDEIFSFTKKLNQQFSSGTISINDQLVTPIEKYEYVDSEKLQRTFIFERMSGDVIPKYILDTYCMTFILDQNVQTSREIDNPEIYASCMIKRELSPALLSHKFKQDIKLAGGYILLGGIIEGLILRYFYTPRVHIPLFDLIFDQQA